MKMRIPLALCVSFTLLASTNTFIGTSANAASTAPKVILPSPTAFMFTKVLGDRLMIANDKGQVFALNSQMKIVKISNSKVLGYPNPSNMEILGNRIFFLNYQASRDKGTTTIVSLDEKNVLKTHLLPVSKNAQCLPIASLGEKYYVECGEPKFKNGWPLTRLFSFSASGSITEIKLPMEGTWSKQYFGSNQILFHVKESKDSSVERHYALDKIHRFYSMDINGIVSHQFDINNIFGNTVNIVAGRENGWIISSGLTFDRYPTFSDCGVGEETDQIFFVDSSGFLKTFGELGSNEFVYFDDYWSSKGRFYFERQIVNSERCFVRKEKYEVDEFGEAKKISNQPGVGTPRKAADASEEIDSGLYWDSHTSPEEIIRESAARKICTLLSKGKAQGKTMFNGYAICRQDNKLVAYPYPEWKMPQSAASVFPIIEQSASNLQIEPERRQAAGVGAPSWPVKCPEFVDAPWRIGTPKIPGLYETPQPRVLGFKFDGTGQTFTRLADGTSAPSKKPDNLIGCYANLFEFDSNPKGANGWQIGSISRDSSGYYWTNAAGVRWGLTLSGANLITDKENPYYDDGRQFITF